MPPGEHTALCMLGSIFKIGALPSLRHLSLPIDESSGKTSSKDKAKHDSKVNASLGERMDQIKQSYQKETSFA